MQVAYNLALATPATSMVPDRTSITIPSRPAITGEKALRLSGLEPVLLIPLPWPIPWRGDSSWVYGYQVTSLTSTPEAKDKLYPNLNELRDHEYP